jgi:ketosteroid isomerase-like protein
MSGLATTSEQQVEQLAARLAELEDKQALAALLSRYTLAVDSFDWEAWGRCWAEDAVADWGELGQLQGREAIVKASRQAETIYEHRGGMQHLLANLDFEVDGDTAKGTGNLLFACSLNSVKSPPDYACGGKYRWTFARGAEGWQITRAELKMAWSAGADVAGTFG